MKREMPIEELLEELVKACREKHKDVNAAAKEVDRILDELFDTGEANGCGLVIRASREVGKFEVRRGK